MISYAEDILEAFEGYLESNLATFLTAIATEKGDSKTPADLNDVVVGVYDASKYNNFPMGFLIPVAEEYEELTLGSDLLTMTVHMWVIDRGYAEETLTTRVARLASAVRNAVRAMSVPGTVGEAIVRGIEYFPRIYGVEEAQGARLTIEITQEV